MYMGTLYMSNTYLPPGCTTAVALGCLIFESTADDPDLELIKEAIEVIKQNDSRLSHGLNSDLEILVQKSIYNNELYAKKRDWDAVG